MTLPTHLIASSFSEIDRLLVHGIVGFHTHFEITEVFSCKNTTLHTTNILTIVVAEEHASPVPTKPPFLGGRIRLRAFPEEFFGIRQTILPISQVLPQLRLLGQGSWLSSAVTIHLGEMTAAAPQFVYPDSSFATPWNRILKNNFSNGSHVFDFVDRTKLGFSTFFDAPPLLQELSTRINEQLPIGLASMSDKLGNLVVQIPVSLLAVRFSQQRVTGDTNVDVAWHPKAISRPLRATVSNEFDKAFDGYASADVLGAQTVLRTHAGAGDMNCVLWDDANGTVLAAQGRTGFIRHVVSNIHTLSHRSEPRVFWVSGPDGQRVEKRVPMIQSSTSQIRVPDERGTDWTYKRIYREENEVALKERLFVQYTPGTKSTSEAHEGALADLRHLISRHGYKGAWLWDPYLEAPEILDTLFHCPHMGSDLRALTEGKEPPAGVVKPTLSAVLRYYAKKLPWVPQPPSFAEKQRRTLAATQSNLLGLRLEYRMKLGGAGWAFHDRFLIFPGDDGSALAWSLGTSVNSVGRSHHILQRVDDGRRVMDAFLDLWNKMDKPEQLIWKAT